MKSEILSENDVSRIVLRGEREIVELIDVPAMPSDDTKVVCKEFKLPGEFPPSVRREAKAVADLLAKPGDRLDLRDEWIVTVDPETAKDFDDAISLEVNGDGTRTLGVHIADVSHFVRPGSALDKEAASRANSIYLVDKVIPMLPEVLCNGVCSLRPDEDRLSFSVFITYDTLGRVVKRKFAKSIIRSKCRLTYAQALAVIEDRGAGDLDPRTVSLLKESANLALQLRANRMRFGALDLIVPECEVKLDESGRMTGIAVREYDVSHQMIEECMVAANEAVATELAQHSVRIIERLHEQPDEEKLDDLTEALKSLGMRPGDISVQRNLARFISSIADHPLRGQAHTMILRAMKRAVYSADATGHYGLAKHFYSHFTSPIRRYPDLVLHRQLAAWLAGDRTKQPTANYLRNVARHCSEREQLADDAERALVEVKKYRFMEELMMSGRRCEFDAVISNVTSFGVFVDIPELAVGGLVHVSLMSDRFLAFDSASNSLRAPGVEFKLGDHIRVFPVKVDFNQRHIDFAPVKSTSTAKAQSSKRAAGARGGGNKKPSKFSAPKAAKPRKSGHAAKSKILNASPHRHGKARKTWQVRKGKFRK